MKYAKITKDLLFEQDPQFYVDAGIKSRESVTWGRNDWESGPDSQGEPLLKVRLLDDDRIPYYEAEATDEILEDLFDWALRDAGVTVLQICKDGEWVDEIS